MVQLNLPGFLPPERVVNVASVKHRSPFRYPGGKTWLVPRIRRWLLSLEVKPRVFVEPFAGGAIVGLTVAFEGLADHVMLVELDEQVAAVWEAIINDGEGPWLADSIRTFEMSPETVDAILERDAPSTCERAFQTIIKNRVNRGGILAEGAGRMKYGENGKGLASRWYPDTLSRRILDIDAVRERLTFVHGDGIVIIEEEINEEDTVFFIDPPYTAAEKSPGSRLYNYSEIDHAHLFDLASNLAGDFLMTYNNVEEIDHFAREHGFETQAIAMRNTHNARKSELLIERDLSWL